jgi:hypothetical protein
VLVEVKVEKTQEGEPPIAVFRVNDTECFGRLAVMNLGTRVQVTTREGLTVVECEGFELIDRARCRYLDECTYESGGCGRLSVRNSVQVYTVTCGPVIEIEDKWERLRKC